MIEQIKINRWYFHAGDVPFPEILGHQASYAHAKTGTAEGAAAEVFGDQHWPVVQTPHDFVITQPHDPATNLSQGYRPRGIGWYRTYFRLPAEWQSQNFEIEFGAIASHASVWLNGCLIARSTNGYLPIRCDVTSFLHFDRQLNVLAVRADATVQQGWWYEGGGIYRDVNLTRRLPCHFATDSLWSVPNCRADKKSWDVPVEVELANASDAHFEGQVLFEIITPDGGTLCGSQIPVTLKPWESGKFRTTLLVCDPALWSPESPSLYRLRARLIHPLADCGTEHESIAAPLGFRTIDFCSQTGFHLNGNPYKIQGVCCHQDHAGVGVAVPRSLLRWRLERLKEIGANAYRCAHHPPSRDLLELADELGLLVMDETRTFSSAPFALDELQAMIHRDRKHPCVFLWSIANEEFLQGSPTGVAIARRMRAVIREMDSSRPVTAAMNGGLFAKVHIGSVVDVVGINYQSESYDAYHEQNPAHCLLSTEDISGFMNRGEFFTDWTQHRVNAYDDEHAPWGTTQREGWRRIAERPFIAGGFLWTGFDYHGEPSPLEWPTNSSLFGCLDLCGFPKTAFYIKKCHWRPQQKTLFLFPHWNHQGNKGALIRVIAVTNAIAVDLQLNGKSLGVKAVPIWDFPSWDVPYEPGCLEAIATWPDGTVSRFARHTSGAAKRLVLEVDDVTPSLAPNQVLPIRVRAVDADGREVPNASHLIQFRTEGSLKIVGVGNGDPNCLESETGCSRSLYHGLAQVLIEAVPEVAQAEAALIAVAEGLESARLEFQLNFPSTTTPVALALEQPLRYLKLWRLSQPHSTRPDPAQRISSSDMNSWEFLDTNSQITLAADSWYLIRATLEAEVTGTLVMPRLGCLTECWQASSQLVEVERIPESEERRWKLNAWETPSDITFVLRVGETVALSLQFPPYVEHTTD